MAEPERTTILCLVALLVVSEVAGAFSQTLNPQNIQTFYPFPLPPPPPRIDETAMEGAGTRAAVGRAIGVTFAATLVLSGFIFFLLLRFSRRRKGKELVGEGGGGVDGEANQAVPSGFMRVNGNLKGVIVDENGLDVLYWKNLADGGNRESFKKQIYRSFKEERRTASGRERERKPSPPIQQVPLLRGKSSTSHSPIWAEDKPNLSSIEIVAVANPPPPPPPPPPPKPPQIHPSHAIRAEASPVATAPPRPPPPPPGRNSAPAPAPPPDATSPSSSSNGNAEMKLKPLHWDKMKPESDHSMVWDKIDKGSFKFDGDLMEALFGYVATNRKSPRNNGRSPIPRDEKAFPPSQISILDPRKSQNTAIVLKSLGVTRKEILDALIEGQGLSADAIEKLAKIAPTEEEAPQLLAFDGDPTRLADAESFLYHLLKAVPSAFTRFNAMLFRTTYDAEVSQVRESLQSLESACNELRNRGLFLKLLEAVLKAGNRLNAGTSRGNAQAFNLTALRKLSDVKSSDGKLTLLQFVVQEVVRGEGKRCVLNRNRSLNRTTGRTSNSDADSDEAEREYMILGLPIVGGLSAEFLNVKKAAALDNDSLVKTISALTSQITQVQKTLARCGSEGGFALGMKGFLETAELEMKVVQEEQARVMELVRRTTDYYHAGSFKETGANALQLFVIVRDFLVMVDQVCVEIARNVQRRKPGSAFADSSPGSPRVFKFPKLPANFLSESSSSGSDNEQHHRQDE